MTIFVTPEYLKAHTTVAQNVDVNDVVPLIRAVAESWVRPYIGTVFFNDLLEKFTAQTLNQSEAELVQTYIKPSIAWRACAEAVITLSYQLKNKGVQTQSGEYSASTDFKNISFIHQHYKDRADMYDAELVKFLEANGAAYPVFMSAANQPKISKQGCKTVDTFTAGILFI